MSKSENRNLRLSNFQESSDSGSCQNSFADLIKMANNSSDVFAKSEIETAVKEAEKNRPPTLLEVYEADKKARTSAYVLKQKKKFPRKPSRNFTEEAQVYLTDYAISHEVYEDEVEEVKSTQNKVIVFVEKSKALNFAHFEVKGWERKN